MIFHIDFQDRILEVKLTLKKSLRHTYLRVLSQNQIEIKSNSRFTIDDAKDLILKKQNWINQSVISFSQRKIILENQFLYFGKVENIENYKIRNLDNFYKNEAQKLIPFLVEKHSKIMNLEANSISYRKNKRTWGSCNQKNDLKFNILLMKFPMEIIEYVVIHELSHIKHKNHSKEFWDLVEKYCPDYKQREKLFKSFL